MIEKLFKTSISLAVLVVVAGIVAAPLVGSSKAFELAPVFSAIRGLGHWIAQSAEDSTQPEANPQPFVEEAKAANQRIQKATNKAIAKAPAFSPDPRLSICPHGSVDQQNARDLPLTTAQALKQSLESGTQFTGLIEVQSALGLPACNWKVGSTRQWRYLVRGGRIVDAKQQGNQPITITFANF